MAKPRSAKAKPQAVPSLTSRQRFEATLSAVRKQLLADNKAAAVKKKALADEADRWFREEFPEPSPEDTARAQEFENAKRDWNTLLAEHLEKRLAQYGWRPFECVPYDDQNFAKLREIKEEMNELRAAMHREFGAEPPVEETPQQPPRGSASHADRLPPETVEPPNASQKTDTPHATDHSDDFRSVIWSGEMYSFTASQAPVVSLLWDHFNRGTPDVSDETLLSAVDEEAPPKRLNVLFREHPAWGTMIVPGKTKGTHRLCAPN